MRALFGAVFAAALCSGCAHGGAVVEACRRGDVAACWQQGQQTSDALERANLFDRACDGGYSDACPAYRSMVGGRGEGAHSLTAADLDARCAGGDLQACMVLGHGLTEGVMGETDAERGAALLRRACEGGIDRACVHHARLLRDGEGDAAALSLLVPRCNQGDGEACHACGHAVSDGVGGFPDVARARAIFEETCRAGYLHACEDLATMHINGRGGPPDPGAAAALLETTCTHGYLRACDVFGYMLAGGDGIPADPERGASILRDACDRGYGGACLDLIAVLARLGEDRITPEEAFGLAQRSVDLGEINGLYILATFYEAGFGTAPDFEKAAGYFTGLCEAMSQASACRELGRMLLKPGDHRDVQRGATWLIQACGRADAEACHALAIASGSGEGGVPELRNEATATEYRQRACSLGLKADCEPPEESRP